MLNEAYFLKVVSPGEHRGRKEDLENQSVVELNLNYNKSYQELISFAGDDEHEKADADSNNNG